MTLNRERHDLLTVVAGGQAIVFDTVNDVTKIAQRHRRAVAISHDQLTIFFCVDELPVRLHRQVLMDSVERADGKIRIAALQCRRDVVDANAARGQRRRIDLHAHGVLLFAGDQHLRDSTYCREPLCQRRVGILIHFGKRQRRRTHH